MVKFYLVHLLVMGYGCVYENQAICRHPYNTLFLTK